MDSDQHPNPLRQILEQYGLSQRQLASHLEIGDAQVNRWMRVDNGVTPRRFYRREIVRWLRGLDIDVEETDLWDLRKK